MNKKNKDLMDTEYGVPSRTLSPIIFSPNETDSKPLISPKFH